MGTKKAILVIAVVALLGGVSFYAWQKREKTSVSFEQSIPDNWKVYDNHKLGFTFKYPPSFVPTIEQFDFPTPGDFTLILESPDPIIFSIRGNYPRVIESGGDGVDESLTKIFSIKGHGEIIREVITSERTYKQVLAISKFKDEKKDLVFSSELFTTDSLPIFDTIISSITPRQ